VHFSESEQKKGSDVVPERLGGNAVTPNRQQLQVIFWGSLV